MRPVAFGAERQQSSGPGASVLWLGSRFERESGELSSLVASVRLRCLLPARRVSTMPPFHRVRIADLRDLPARLTRALAQADVAILGKVPGGVEFPAGIFRAAEVPLILDLCDDPFERPHMWKSYSTLLPVADVIVTPSNHLADKLRQRLDKHTVVIADPIEYLPAAEPLPERPGSSISLCWFGDPVNLCALIAQLPSIAKCRVQRILLRVVTRLEPSVLSVLEHAITAWRGRIEIQPVAWSRAGLPAELHRCHLVVVPVGPQEWAKSKSANRVQTSIQLNRPCVAGPVPSYLPLAPFACIDADLGRGIDMALAYWADWPDRLSRGRQFIARSGDVDVVAADWSMLIARVAGDHRARGSPGSTRR